MKQYFVALFALVFVVGCHSARNGDTVWTDTSASAPASEQTILYDKLSEPPPPPPTDGMPPEGYKEGRNEHRSLQHHSRKPIY
jgi:hypothetical protein